MLLESFESSRAETFDLKRYPPTSVVLSMQMTIVLRRIWLQKLQQAS